ncbi:MAG: biotin/lipoyl-binding protein, partial [Calditrichota bacterium]
VNNRPYHVEIKKLGTDTAVVEVEGREYEVGIERKIKRHVEPLEVKPVRKDSATPAAVPSTPAPGPAVAAGDAVVAPLPGLILSILVKTGDTVSAGQTVLKMEAMKMENEIKANKGGKVQEIYIKENEAVLENAPLIKIGD